jgi:geranylgeranyl pyrophosphate synthase
VPGRPASDNAAERLDEIIRSGGEELPALLEQVEERLREIAGAGPEPVAGWAAGTIAAGGKRLRPLLVLLAAGPRPADPARLVRAAVAIELVHAATLVHDDVLDVAGLRRGRPTVYAAAGRRIATATGDALFARAFAELADNDDAEQVRLLSRASSSLARGELLQREDAWRADVAVERYLERCEYKTARLFEAACAIGERNGSSPSPTSRLVPFGRGIGLAFQLLDDVLDVSGPVERTGKPRGADLLDGTVTLPLILARERDPELAALDPRAIASVAEAERVCDAIAASGVLDEVRARALALIDEAKAALPSSLAAEQHRALELVAANVVDRYS